MENESSTPSSSLSLPLPLTLPLPSQTQWKFKQNETVIKASSNAIRGTLDRLMANVGSNQNSIIFFGHGDPSTFPGFRITSAAEAAIGDALKSAKFNCYAPTVGVASAKRAIAEHLSRDLPTSISANDIYMTVGATQGIETVISVLAQPGANILLPRPGYPMYESRATYSRLKVRHFDLLPDNGWEVDLHSVESLADENTVAMVVINPGNPSGSVFSYQHLNKIAETAKKLGIMVISDEVYAHLVFGANPFVSMGVFSTIVPVITLGSISKRWVVPGWRLGWLAICDPNGVLCKSGIVESIKSYISICCDPVTFIQGAVPEILKKTDEKFFTNIVNLLREDSTICFDRIKDMPGLTCPRKSEGAMCSMVKLNLPLLEDIEDDVDFCMKLAKEESVVILPGVAVGLKNWVRITFAVDLLSLEEGLSRMKMFCERHTKKQQSE